VLYDPLKPFPHIQSHTVRINVRYVSRRITLYFTSYTFVTELQMRGCTKSGKVAKAPKKTVEHKTSDRPVSGVELGLFE